MNNHINPVALFKAVKNEIGILYSGYQEDIAPPNDTNINEFSRNEHSVKLTLDAVNFKILTVSDNVEALYGYSHSDLCKLDMSFVLGLFELDHFLFPHTMYKWVNGIAEKGGDLLNYKGVYCGLKVKHKDGHVMRVMVRHSALEQYDNGGIRIAAFSIDNISHLMRGDFYWGRITYGTDTTHIHHLFSADNKDIPHDIISVREKDVLQLAAQGLESSEIAKKLFISSFTVDNHRRNMIAKTGVRDLTSLIQICKMNGII
jgi:DNA-binding CsgD family transcriptional regulator